MSLGVYIHFPWCRKLCPYCDFAVEVGAPPHAAYADAILAELATRADGFPGPLESIYLGGGTPSLWTDHARVIAAVRERWGEPREVTIEANPTDCTTAQLDAWRAAGIDRISIGVQSLAPAELVTLGRDHRHGDGLEAVARGVAAGFSVSADFIIGTPGRGAPDWSWIDAVLATGVTHLSVYELTIEDRTAFGKRVAAGRLVPLDEAVLTELYLAAHARLTAAGFEHYEISSYARPGKRAVHNSRYWTGAAYLGLGVGAASLQLVGEDGVRSTNPRRWAAYARGAPPEISQVPADEMATDRLWLGMRTSDGVAEADLGALGEAFVSQGLAERRGGRICPTLRGFLMADRMAAQIVEAR